MSAYNENITFAKRVLVDYHKFKRHTDFQFTLACSTILNVFSAILPDGELIVENLNTEELPQFDRSGIKRYVKGVRDALAHKTRDNFEDYNDDERITKLKLSSRSGKLYVFSLADLHKIIEIFEESVYRRPE